MSKPFDATTKQLVASQPDDWLAYIGLPGARGEAVEADLSTITAEADRVLRVTGPDPFLAHLEFQASYDPNMGRRLLRYNALLHYRHELPVLSVVALLRREADGPAITGAYRAHVGQAAADSALDFRYRVVRVWERDVETALTGGLGTLPLAPLANVSAPELPRIVRRMEARIEREAATPAEAGMLWTATYLLMGLKYPPDLTDQILKGVRQMKESSTYQAILAEGRSEGLMEGRVEGRAEGRVDEARNLVLRLGRRRFGPSNARSEAALAAVDSVERLEQLAERVLEVETWEELLA